MYIYIYIYIYISDNAYQILEGGTKPVITNNGDGAEIINLEL